MTNQQEHENAGMNSLYNGVIDKAATSAIISLTTDGECATPPFTTLIETVLAQYAMCSPEVVSAT